MPPRLLAWSAAVLAGAAGPAPAGVVVLTNATDQEVRFTLAHPGGKPVAEALGPWESRPFPAGRQPEVGYVDGGKPARYRLDPYHAYMFTRAGGPLAVHGVELAGPMPAPADVPDGPPAAARPARLPVKVLADDADPLVRAAWEKAYRQRVAAASDVLARQCGVTLDVVAVGEWPSDPGAADARALLADFEGKVRPAPAQLALGFSSRRVRAGDGAPGTTLGCSRGPLHSHVLIREGFLRTEAERVEVLVHEVAHLLGAAHAPDPVSAMRPKLGDGRARTARFRVGLDPLNVLAVAIWVEEIRGGKVRTWADLSPAARERLGVVYKTLAQLTRDDPLAADYLVALEQVKAGDGGAGVAARDPDPDPAPRGNPAPGGGGGAAAPKPADPVADPEPRPEPLATPAGRKLSPREEAVRKVVRAVAVRAADLNRLPDRPQGDRLTAEYVRAAASVAVALDDPVQAPAFLLGLGIGLDDSNVLRDNPLTRDLCRAAEPDEERRERVAALGVPTVRNRRDLCQHFAVSAALTEVVGPAAAEAAGLGKELLDMDKPSGFSFPDLAADLAGVGFARRVRKDPGLLRGLQAGFAVEDWVPDVAGLREGLSGRRFKADFGGTTDPRFVKALDEVRQRVKELPSQK